MWFCEYGRVCDCEYGRVCDCEGVCVTVCMCVTECMCEWCYVVKGGGGRDREKVRQLNK